MLKLLPSFLLIFIFSSTAILAQNDISKFDFGNFTYQPLCGQIERQNFSVVNGSFFEEYKLPPLPRKKNDKTTPADRWGRKYFKVFQIVIGDMNGDGRNEAAVLTTCSTGGVESFTEGFVYGQVDGDIKLITRIEGGDRALGGLRNASIKNGSLLVSRSRPGVNGDVCCAEFAETTSYKLTDQSLVMVGEKSSVEIYPPLRIQMTDAPSNAGFNFHIKKRDKYKRFVISAKKGETIQVSTSSRDGRLRLFSGIGTILVNPKPVRKDAPFIAKDVITVAAKENGEFVFEVSNLSDGNVDLDVTIRIEIK